MTSLQQQTVTADEIAAALEYTPAYFLRLVPDLIENHGMPQRLPGRRRWSRIRVERWLSTYGDAADLPALRTLPAPVADERQRLHLAYVNPDMEGARA